MEQTEKSTTLLKSVREVRTQDKLQPPFPPPAPDWRDTQAERVTTYQSRKLPADTSWGTGVG